MGHMNDIPPDYNQLFREGISDKILHDLTKQTNRPEKCEGLSKIKCNALVWNIMPPQARSGDRNLQVVQSSLLKATQLVLI